MDYKSFWEGSSEHPPLGQVELFVWLENPETGLAKA